jgi:hypothetical protein
MIFRPGGYGLWLIEIVWQPHGLNTNRDGTAANMRLKIKIQ